jgi:glucose-1-phosphate cytidylyltransferase
MDFGINMENSTNEFNQIPVAILCGGKGILLDEKQNQRQNKSLIQVLSKPLFWWVMHHYALHGATNFILATGFQGEKFGAALEAAGGKVDAGDANCYVVTIATTSCHVRVVPTALDATTGERLLACKPWLIKAERFALTYSDTLSDVDLSAEVRFHKNQKLVATLVATKYPVRFRILGMRHGEAVVRAFAPRPVIEAASINGGYYIFSTALWDDAYALSSLVALENQPLERLAAAGQLAAFEHKGNWQHCDAERDLVELSNLAQQLNMQTRS